MFEFMKEFLATLLFCIAMVMVIALVVTAVPDPLLWKY